MSGELINDAFVAWIERKGVASGTNSIVDDPILSLLLSAPEEQPCRLVHRFGVQNAGMGIWFGVHLKTETERLSMAVPIIPGVITLYPSSGLR